MSKRISALLAAEQELGQRARDFGLADAGGSQEQERSGRTLGRLQAGARTADGARQSAEMAFSWLMTRLCSSSSMRSSLVISSSLMAVIGTPVQRATTSSMSSLVTHAGGGVVEVVLLAQLAHVLALFALFVGVEARLLELVVRDGVLHAVHDELDALLDVGEIARQRGLAQLHARAGFVDQIDGLVRQEAVRNVAAGSVDRGLDRLRRCTPRRGTSRSGP